MSWHERWWEALSSSLQAHSFDVWAPNWVCESASCTPSTSRADFYFFSQSGCFATEDALHTCRTYLFFGWRKSTLLSLCTIGIPSITLRLHTTYLFSHLLIFTEFLVISISSLLLAHFFFSGLRSSWTWYHPQNAREHRDSSTWRCLFRLQTASRLSPKSEYINPSPFPPSSPFLFQPSWTWFGYFPRQGKTKIIWENWIWWSCIGVGWGSGGKKFILLLAMEREIGGVFWKQTWRNCMGCERGKCQKPAPTSDMEMLEWGSGYKHSHQHLWWKKWRKAMLDAREKWRESLEEVFPRKFVD